MADVASFSLNSKSMARSGGSLSLKKPSVYSGLTLTRVFSVLTVFLIR